MKVLWGWKMFLGESPRLEHACVCWSCSQLSTSHKHTHCMSGQLPLSLGKSVARQNTGRDRLGKTSETHFNNHYNKFCLQYLAWFFKTNVVLPWYGVVSKSNTMEFDMSYDCNFHIPEVFTLTYQLARATAKLFILNLHHKINSSISKSIMTHHDKYNGWLHI